MLQTLKNNNYEHPLYQNLILNHIQLQNVYKNIENVLKGEETSDVKEAPPIDPMDIINQIEDIQKETMKTVQNNDSNDKHQTIDKARDYLNKLQRTQASNQSYLGNYIEWSATYLSDTHPLVPTTIIVYISLIHGIDSYFQIKECNLLYQLSRWGALVIMVLYLTAIGYKVSKFRSRPALFLKQFWTNWVVFILLAVQMSLPPVPCYFGDSQYIVAVATVILIIFALGLSFYASPWTKRYLSKWFGGKKWYSKPFGIDGFDQNQDEKEVVITMMPEIFIESKPNKPVHYINEIEFDVNDNQEIEIIGVKLNDIQDINFDELTRDKEMKFAQKINNYMDQNIDGDREEDLKTESGENKYEEPDDDKNNDGQLEHVSILIDKENNLNKKIDNIISIKDKAKDAYDKASAFIAVHDEVDNECIQYNEEQRNYIKFNNGEYCKKIRIFSKRAVENDNIQQIIGIQLTTNHDSLYIIGSEQLKLSENMHEYWVDRKLIDPYSENGDKNEYALVQITKYMRKDGKVVGLSFAFIVVHDAAQIIKEEENMNEQGLMSSDDDEWTPMLQR